ncbi:MAG TPA: hypothetical protein VII23_06740 [Terriglobales bacterium]
MKVITLFDETGKVYALFHPSSKPDAPELQFAPANGQRVETLEVPVELEHLKPHQLHAAVCVEHRSGKPALVKRS